MWAAIGYQGVIGPFFYEEHQTVNANNYLAMLENFALPLFRAIPGFEFLIFMQDGAPPHWARAVRRFLSEVFFNRWMGRDSPSHPWPPNSPDLTVCDYFLWGWIKARVYTTPIADIAELRARIEQAFRDLPQQMINRGMDAYRRRLEYCIRVGGRSVEEKYADVEEEEEEEDEEEDE